ncbi:hypothetical protein SEA_GIRLPOWER_10 [Streptomyces phage GirlPower]|nr:hypothetical protein SEA_GIRLPOWER_10 [Streptomyces phage GirlPower]
MSEELVHYGVKGMKWGVRKDDDVAGRFQPVGEGPKMDSRVHPVSQQAAREVAALIQERYGYKIREVKAITPDNEEYARGTLGYVANNGKQKLEGDIYIAMRDPTREMKASEKMGWVAKGLGTPVGLLTHESGHAIFHSREKYDKDGKVVGGEKEARMKALQALVDEAKRKRIPEHRLLRKLSGYAAASQGHEEIEAELFSQYHWHPKPPSFVTVWGQTLHKELGIDPTPFKEMR